MKAQTQRILCAAFVLSNWCYYQLAFFPGRPWQKLAGPALARYTPLCSSLAVVALVLAILIALRKLRLRTEAAELITSLALAESATALFGLLLFFLACPPRSSSTSSAAPCSSNSPASRPACLGMEIVSKAGEEQVVRLLESVYLRK